VASEPGHDIFISYAREDEQRVRPLVRALEAQGWRVFWDRSIPIGETWLDHIGTRLEAAPVVLVAWSRHSVRSEFVYSEASRARGRRVLVPVLIEPVSPPLGLDSVQAADLVPWLDAGGKAPLPAVLVEALGRRISAPAGDVPNDRPAAPPTSSGRAPSLVRNLVIASVAVMAVVVAGAALVPQVLRTGTAPQAKKDERPTAIAPPLQSAAPTAPGGPSGARAPSPLPFPTVEFMLESRLVGSSGGAIAPGTRTVLRHKDGKLRMDFETFGTQAYVLAERDVDTAVMVMIQPPATVLAMNIDLSQPMPGTNTLAGLWWRTVGTPFGSDRIMGEPCEWWLTEAADPVQTCFTADGIPLKVVKATSGETHWQMVRLERGAQDAAQFVLPANAQRLQPPTLQRQ